MTRSSRHDDDKVINMNQIAKASESYKLFGRIAVIGAIFMTSFISAVIMQIIRSQVCPNVNHPFRNYCGVIERITRIFEGAFFVCIVGAFIGGVLSMASYCCPSCLERCGSCISRYCLCGICRECCGGVIDEMCAVFDTLGCGVCSRCKCRKTLDVSGGEIDKDHETHGLPRPSNTTNITPQSSNITSQPPDMPPQPANIPPQSHPINMPIHPLNMSFQPFNMSSQMSSQTSYVPPYLMNTGPYPNMLLYSSHSMPFYPSMFNMPFYSHPNRPLRSLMDINYVTQSNDDEDGNEDVSISETIKNIMESQDKTSSTPNK